MCNDKSLALGSPCAWTIARPAGDGARAGQPAGPGRGARRARRWSSTRSGSAGSRSRSELVARTGLTAASSRSASASCSSSGSSSRARSGRAPAVVRRAGSRSGPMPGTSWSPTWAPPASTWRSRTSTGRILGHRDEPADVSAGPERCLRAIEELFEELLDATRDLPGPLWGVGIGVPGPVEFRTGRPVSPPIMPGWDGYPVRERFADRYGAPVWVDNDVNILALGEWRSGIAVGHDNVVVVKIGTGIGAGIISNGRIHRGAQGSAGDVGHIQVVDAASVVCRCGNVGCLEALAGGAALGRDGEAAAAAAAASGCGRARPARPRDRRGRGAGRLVRRSGRRRLLQAAGHRVGLDAGQHRELLQPVAGRRRRRRGTERRPAAGGDPRDGLSPLAAAGHPRPGRPAVVARRAGRRRRRVGDGGRPALLPRLDGALEAGRRAIRDPGRRARREG